MVHNMMNETISRKKSLEKRLEKHGIRELKINYLPYLEFNKNDFATPHEAGCRMIILYSVAYTAMELDDRETIADWLKDEGIWPHVAPSERELFAGKVLDQEQLMELSWQGECAYILAWALDLIKESPSPTEAISDKQLDVFMERMPPLGAPLTEFLENLRYRNIAEVFDENLFHELATTHFRDRMFSGQESGSDIDRNVSFLRHITLNWLRRFMGIEDWDETDTST